MAPIYVFLLPSLPRQHGTRFLQKLQRLDWLGTTLSIGMHVSFVLILTFGGTVWSWGDGRIITLYAVFGIVLLAFCATQYFCTLTTYEARLFPGEFLRNRSLILLYILVSCGGASLFVAVYYIPLFFLLVHGDSGTQAAVRLLPFICFYVATILLCGYIMPKTGYYMFWYLASGGFITIGSALMYTVQSDTSPAKIYGYSILLGLGMTTSQAAYAVGPTMVPSARVAECIQFMNISQGQSQLLGLTIASAIFQNTTLKGLGRVLDSGGYSKGEIQAAIAGATSKILNEVDSETRSSALKVIVHSIDSVYAMVIAAGALYVVCSLFLKREK